MKCKTQAIALQKERGASPVCCLPRASKIILFLTLLLSCFYHGTANAQCCRDTLIINTGYDPGTHAAITPGANMGTPVHDPMWMVDSVNTDLHYIIVTQYKTPASPNADVINRDGAWIAPGPNAQYINCFNDESFTWPSGIPTVFFSRQFTVCANDSIKFDLLIADDNWIKEIIVIPITGTGGGVINGPGPYPQIGVSYTSFNSYKKTMWLTTGTYKLRLRLEEDLGGVNAIGMCVKGTISSHHSLGEPFVEPIVGHEITCCGNDTLTDATPGGTWSITPGTGTATISSTGIVSCTSPGTDTVHYTVTDSCGTATSTLVITFLGVPTILGHSVCVGDTAHMTTTSGSGTWSVGSASPSIATIDAAGILHGVSAGVVIVTYTDHCGHTVHLSLTVNAAPPISGASSVCKGATTTFTNTASGTWTSSNSSIASIGISTGVITGVNTGTAIITFTSSLGCKATKIISVEPIPAITGPTSVCVGATITLGCTLSGSWTSSNSLVASIGTGTGIVTGVSSGTATITFTSSFGCIGTYVITVNPSPAISGSPTLCLSSVTAFSPSSGGTWSSSPTSVATVTSSGVVTAVALGTATISFVSATTGCLATMHVTVEPLPVSTGVSTLCIGGWATFSSSATGTWSSTSGVSVTTTSSTTATVSGVSAGTATITFTSSFGCVSTTVVSVAPLPVITADSMCIGDTRTLVSNMPGGTWISGNSSIATINVATGVVLGVSSGTAVITYTDTCGHAAYSTVTVFATPAITGVSTVCIGSTITLSSTGSGTWSTTDATVSVDMATGVVTGAAAGTAVITFTSVHGCISTKIVTVLVTPVITGAPVCIGATTTLSSSTGSGTWISSDLTIATVDLTTGVVTGVSAGTVTMTFTGTCTATYVVTVLALPTISGVTTVCPIASETLHGSPSTGTWSGGSSLAYVTDMGGGIGVVTGVSVGTVELTYTDGAGCSSTVIVTVHCPCPLVDSSLTTLTSTVTYGDGCKYICTATTSTISGWTIAGYLWETGGAPIWDASTATTDNQSVSVPYSGTQLVKVTIYVVDSTGDTCTTVRTITVTCDRQPCFYDDGTNLVVTASTDDDGNCVYTATASVSTSHTVLGYEWNTTGGTPVVVYTSATSNVYTFTLPSGTYTTVSVIIHIVDPYFAAGTSPCCDANFSQDVVCGDTSTQGCKCFDSLATTIVSSPVKCNGNNGCCYKVTVNAGLSDDCKITGYSWDVSGTVTWVPSSATSDAMIITVPSGGATTVIVTIIAVDSKGRECVIIKTIDLTCGCACFKDDYTTLTSALSSVQPPTGCSYDVTAIATVNQPCKIVSYTWQAGFTAPVTLYTGAPSTSMSYFVAPLTSVIVTVTIQAIDANGDSCSIVRTITLSCGNAQTGCCFDSLKSRLTFTSSTDASGDCIYHVNAIPVLSDRKCRFIGFIWQTSAGYYSGIVPSSTLPVTVPPGTSLTVTVTFIAVNASGDTCTLVKTIVLNCSSKPAGREAESGTGNNGDIRVFPNPTDNDLTISSDKVSINTIQVIDVNGKKVGNYTYDHAKKANISLDKLTPGTYLLRINNEISRVVTKKR